MALLGLSPPEAHDRAPSSPQVTTAPSDLTPPTPIHTPTMILLDASPQPIPPFNSLPPDLGPVLSTLFPQLWVCFCHTM